MYWMKIVNVVLTAWMGGFILYLILNFGFGLSHRTSLIVDLVFTFLVAFFLTLQVENEEF